MKSEPASEEGESKLSQFSEFQKTEYEHIAEAHFKALEAIAGFFRYYLLVMALPMPLIAVLYRFSGSAGDLEKSVVSLLSIASPVFIIVSCVGFCMMMYIINMKMDVALYSRVVNSIRKYFYDAYEMDHANKLLMRQLPQSASIPSYGDIPFAFIILAFALINIFYFAFGSHVLLLAQLKGASSLQDLRFFADPTIEMWVLGVAAVFFLLHFIAYRLFVRYREFQYLRTTAIGVDIDGVLNKHREKFCELAAVKLEKKVAPEEIKTLPVHENPSLAISRDDERKIFNDPTYWLEMPVAEGAADAIRSIRNSLLLPVHVFTHRPWPDQPRTQSDSSFRQSWRRAARDMAERADAKGCARLWVFLRTSWNYRTSIRYITRYWLKKHGIQFSTLLVERGNENIVYSRGRYQNRFNYAKKKRIRFFVEDDWAKAVKLSYICDIVFLVDHPYNQAGDQELLTHTNETIIGGLPANVIRVKSWLDLKKTIAQLV